MEKKLEEGMIVRYIGNNKTFNNETFTLKEINGEDVLCKSNETGLLWNFNPENIEEI